MALTNTASALRRTGGLIVSRLSEGLKDNNSTASGELDSSIEFKISSKKNKIDMSILMEDYWEFVDQGRRPGKRPPTAPIEEWLTYPNVKDKLGVGSLTEAQTKSLAYIIAKKIGDKGTKGTDFATNVFESRLVTQELPQIIAEAVYEDANLLIDELISNIE